MVVGGRRGVGPSDRAALVTDRELLATAIHEAGHAVASVYLGRGFKRVTIVPENDTLGRLHCNPVGDWFRPDIVADARTRTRVEDQAMIAMAGPEAEARHRGWVEAIGLPGAEHDYETVSELMTHAAGSPAEAEAYAEWLRQRILGFIRNPNWWTTIEWFAEELVSSGTIPGRRATALVREHYRAQVGARLQAAGIMRPVKG